MHHNEKHIQPIQEGMKHIKHGNDITIQGSAQTANILQIQEEMKYIIIMHGELKHAQPKLLHNQN